MPRFIYSYKELVKNVSLYIDSPIGKILTNLLFAVFYSLAILSKDIEAISLLSGEDTTTII